MNQTPPTAWLLASTFLMLCSCVQEGPPFPYERFYDRPLRVVDIEPSSDGQPIATNQTFRVTFNTHLDPSLLNDYNGLILSSGGVRSFGIIRYSITDRALTWTTRRSMEPDLQYTLTVDEDVLRSATGQPYEGPKSATFVVENRTEDPPPEPPRTLWSDVAPIFEACNTCHEDPEWKLSPMRYDSLVGVRSRQNKDLFLVKPYNAPQSYLMHKILWEYPLRQGSAQPPPWADGTQLSRDEQRLIERWIEGGAAR